MRTQTTQFKKKSPDLVTTIFQPILLYGTEIWGLSVTCQTIVGKSPPEHCNKNLWLLLTEIPLIMQGCFRPLPSPTAFCNKVQLNSGSV